MVENVNEEPKKNRWEEIKEELSPEDLEKITGGAYPGQCASGTKKGVELYCSYFDRDNKDKKKN